MPDAGITMTRLLLICTIAFLLLVWLPVGLIVGYIQLIGMKVKKLWRRCTHPLDVYIIV